MPQGILFLMLYCGWQNDAAGFFETGTPLTAVDALHKEAS